MTLKDRIKKHAVSLGADLFGISSLTKFEDYLTAVHERFKDTGASGKDFMLSSDAASFFETLSDPHRALPGVESIIIVGVYSLDTKGDYSETTRRRQGKTARTYAYYPVIRQIAEGVAAFVEKEGHRVTQGQQIPLKYVAHQMGLGAYGWNGLLLTDDFGSYVALRAIMTDATLEPDSFVSSAPECATCRRCLNACPTGALYEPYKVNPALCINPLTRRTKDISPEVRVKMGTWLCGCDICQEVCPANRALLPREPDPRAGFDPAHHSSHRTLGGLERTPDLESLVRESDHTVMQRNALIALGNIGDRESLDVLREMRRDITDPSLLEYCDHSIHLISEEIQ